MRITVFGNGLIGWHVAAHALDAAHDVTLVTEHPENVPDGCKAIPHRASFTRDCSGVAVWVVGVPGPRADAPFRQRVERFEDSLRMLLRFDHVVYVTGAMRQMDGTLVPWSDYGRAHYYCECLLSECRPTVIIRPSTAYGPRQRPGRLISNAILAKLRKQPVFLTDPDATRDFVYAEDVARAILVWMDYGRQVSVRIQSHRSTSLRRVCEILGAEWRMASEEACTERTDSGEPRHVDFGTAPPGSPSVTALEVGLARTLAWYEQNSEWILKNKAWI